MKRSPVPLYPFLAALYPVLALAAENSEEILDPSEVEQAAVMAFAVTGIGWILAGFVTRERNRRGLLALLGALFFGWYGIFASTLRGVRVLAPSADHTSALLLWVLVLVAAAWLIRRRPSIPNGVPRYLNLTTAILLVFPSWTLLRDAGSGGPGEAVMRVAAATAERRASGGPDIYLLILDKYTGATPLRANYGYDNGMVEEALRGRGFFVPTASRANYIHTAQSLASMLNWTHLDEIAGEKGLDSRDRTALYRMIEDNRVWRFLSARGYEFVFFPTPYGATTRNRNADLQLPRPFEPSIHFGAAWFLQTPLAPAMAWLCATAGCEGGGSERFPYPPESARELEWKFRKLAELADRPGPKFVFAHLLVPHEPFVFRADCSHREPVWESDAGSSAARMKSAYVEQIQCVNHMLLRLVDRLLEGAERPPIIVLQADHGHGRIVIDPVHNLTIPRGQLGADQIGERTSVFAAYHFPQGGDSLLYDSITPINVFPIILDHYFGASIPLREDATYWVEPTRPYRFTRIR